MADLPAGDDEAAGLERLALFASALSGRACSWRRSNRANLRGPTAARFSSTPSLDSPCPAAVARRSDVATGRRQPAARGDAQAFATPFGCQAISRRRRAPGTRGERRPAAVRTPATRRFHHRTPSDSAAASLAIALSRQPIADPPREFGIIRARKLLAAQERAASASSADERARSAAATRRRAAGTRRGRKRQRRCRFRLLHQPRRRGRRPRPPICARCSESSVTSARAVYPARTRPRTASASGVAGGGNAVVSRAQAAEPQERDSRRSRCRHVSRVGCSPSPVPTELVHGPRSCRPPQRRCSA